MTQKYKLTVKEEKDSIDFVVEYDKAQWKSLINKKEQETLKKVNIKGFRAGNVPLEIAKKEVNEEFLINSCADDISQDILSEIVSSDEMLKYASLIYLAIPNRIPVNCTKDECSFIFRFDKLATLKEQFKYNTISLPLEMGQKVADEYAERHKNVLLSRKRKTKTIPDTQKPLAKNDVAVFDFVGYVDGEEFEGGKASNFELEIGSGQFIPGFEEQMIGMKMGETKEIKVTFPKEYLMESLAGKEAVFKITLHEIQEFIYPVFNDKFVEDLKSENYKTVEEYEQWMDNIKKSIREENDKAWLQDTLNKFISEHTKLNEQIPINVIMSTFLVFKEEVIKTAANQYGLTFPQYLAAIKMTEEDFNKNTQELAKQSLVRYVGFAYIFNKQNLSITSNDVDGYLDNLCILLKLSKEQIKKEFKNNIMFAFDVLAAIIQDKTVRCLKKLNETNKRFDPTEIRQEHSHDKDCGCENH